MNDDLQKSTFDRSVCMATSRTHLPLGKCLVYRYTVYYGIHHRKPAGYHARYTAGRQLLVWLGTPHSFHSRIHILLQLHGAYLMVYRR